MKPFGAINAIEQKADAVAGQVERMGDDVAAGIQVATDTLVILGVGVIIAILLSGVAVIRAGR